MHNPESKYVKMDSYKEKETAGFEVWGEFFEVYSGYVVFDKLYWTSLTAPML